MQDVFRKFEIFSIYFEMAQKADSAENDSARTLFFRRISSNVASAFIPIQQNIVYLVLQRKSGQLYLYRSPPFLSGRNRVSAFFPSAAPPTRTHAIQTQWLCAATTINKCERKDEFRPTTTFLKEKSFFKKIRFEFTWMAFFSLSLIFCAEHEREKKS